MSNLKNSNTIIILITTVNNKRYPIKDIIQIRNRDKIIMS